MAQQVSVTSLTPSVDGVLFVSAWSVSLRVRNRHLIISARTGREVTEARFARIGPRRLRRLLVSTKGGFTSWEALEWCRGAGVGVLALDCSGNVLASSGEVTSGVPALRRAQVQAAETAVGVSIARYLLGLKLVGQRANLERFFSGEGEAIEAIAAATDRVKESRRIRDVLVWEAKAASAYWRCFTDAEVRFARTDVGKVPDRWRTFGERHSPLSSSPRKAVTPANALLNFLYQLAEYACGLSLAALGMDLQLGWSHVDAPYRNSASLDLLEAVRPKVDAYVAALLRERTFSRREFVEDPAGQVRLGSQLAKLLAESTLGQWEQAAAEPAEEIARILASSARLPVVVRTRLTHADRRHGRVGAKGRRNSTALPNACRLCGVVLDRTDRLYCDGCLPTYDAERTEKLARAGTAALRRMRESQDDPAQSEAARAKRAEKSRQTSLAIRAWEREHGRTSDVDRYGREILPLIRAMNVAELANRTGLSKYFCRQVRRGERALHPSLPTLRETDPCRNH